MQQYRILLVDDEIEVCHSMAAIVDWSACGFILCGTASGAIEAIELAQKYLPDVIITDICMPYMDGLEMIAQLQKLYPAMQFVILSGYNEFSYAQQALKFQVMDYLLKPLSSDELRASLEKIHARLDANMMQRRNLEALSIEAENARGQAASTYLLSLLYESYYSVHRNESSNIHFPGYLAVIQATDLEAHRQVLQRDFASRRDLLELSALSIVNEFVWNRSLGVSVVHRNRIVFLFTCEKETAIECLELILDNLRMYLHLPCKAALSNCITTAEQIAVMYQRLIMLSAEQTPYDAGSVLLMENHPSTSVDMQVLLDSLSADVSHLIRRGDHGRIREYFDQLTHKLEVNKVNTAETEMIYSIIKSVVFTSALRSGIEMDALLPLLEPIVVHQAGLSAVINSLCTYVQAVCQLINEQRALGSKKLIRDIAAYIEEAYRRPDLSISDLCEHFDISQTQLSLLFKRELGTSFLQYVLDKRIQQAKLLLTNSSKKIFEIALETGFEDPGYFSYCFKQRTGTTPKKYRLEAPQNHA